MKERQIEAMYRARFDERRHATQALDALFTEASAGRNTGKRAWLTAVAHPRIPRFRDRITRDEARAVLSKTESLALTYAGSSGIHPVESVDRSNPRPGLRRWVAVNTATGERSGLKESWMSVHNDGSVTLATAIGGHRRSGDAYYEGWQLQSSAIADVMGLIRATAEATNDPHHGQPRVRRQPCINPFAPLHPVETTVNATEPALDFHWHVHDLAQDCVNQGGISNVLMIRRPLRGTRVELAQLVHSGVVYGGSALGVSSRGRPRLRVRYWQAAYTGIS
jgi:hypothetical protein